MDIGITLIGQMVTFGLLVAFTMKFVWPPLTKALEARRAKIAEGLSAADQGKEMLKVAESDALVLIVSAREEAARIVGLARVQGEEMVAQAREEARQEGVRQLEAARMRIDSEERSAREELRKSMEGMLPPGFAEHRRNARKEMLMAWRSMIDASLERMEQPKKKA